MIHIVFGATGAGKTTYAMQLAQELQAIRFSVDDWMKGLFFPDIKAEIEYSWALERVNRCEEQIWQVAQQVLGQGTPVVLEVSMTSKEQRDKQRQRAEQYGFDYSIYFLDVAQATRRDRVRQRNSEQGQTYSFEVTDDMFDFVEALFESPDEDELNTMQWIKN